MNKDDIIRLGNLARIELTDTEADAFARDISSILGYVSDIKEITGNDAPEKIAGPLVNVMRKDENPHEAGLYTEDLLNLAPEREGQYVKVKKILEN